MLAILFLIFRILATVSLFLFLIWALRIIWLDLKRQAAGQPDFQAPLLRLIPPENTQLEMYQANSESVLIGRDPACGLYLGDKTISGHHARLTYQMGQWWIEDLHSMNGTFLNNQPVNTPMVLASGDEIRFGGLSFQAQILEKSNIDINASA
jgi:pSer/pThr/pTyr-binding forkhead associated (FHA) protein